MGMGEGRIPWIGGFVLRPLDVALQHNHSNVSTGHNQKHIRSFSEIHLPLLVPSTLTIVTFSSRL
jgi:hypothetical protein